MATKWYSYDGSVSGPYYDTKQEAREHCEEGETIRPIDDSVRPDIVDVEGGVVDDGGDEGDDGPYADLTQDDLREEVKARGLGDDVDMRSKEMMRAALRDDDD